MIGKVVGHNKSVPRSLFRENVHELGLRAAPFNLLTPHKLFRRALLDEHGIRFPEGRRRLEDHMFVVPAYFAARNMAILADYPCYHWVHWDSGTNASYVAPDPAEYFADVRRRARRGRRAHRARRASATRSTAAGTAASCSAGSAATRSSAAPTSTAAACSPPCAS